MNPTTNMMLFAFFQSPALLWGLAGVSIPILIHLFFRSRFRVVPWGAMKFLLTSIEQTSRRLKFQELLLLICRCALIALLALALAGPTFKRAGSGTSSQPVDVVMVLDTSYTMGAREQTSTRLDAACKKAQQMLADLPAHSTVQIIACSDRATLLGPYLPDDLETARNLLKDLTLTSQASDLEKGIAAAAEILERGQSPVKELYIFSDMQRPALARQAGSIARSLEGIQESVAVTFVHSEPRKLQNVAIISITPQTAAPRPGERCGFSVLLKNTGGGRAHRPARRPVCRCRGEEHPGFSHWGQERYSQAVEPRDGRPKPSFSRREPTRHPDRHAGKARAAHGHCLCYRRRRSG